MRTHHSFRTAAGHYVYDAGLNQVVEIDEVIHAILDDELAGGLDATAAGHDDRFGAAEVARARQEIAQMRDAGLFRRPRREQLGGFCADYLDHTYASGLQQLVLETTEACNLRCRYCVYSGAYQGNRRHGHRHLDPATAGAAIDYFHDHSGETERPAISFYGGEPLLNLDLIRRCVDHAGRHADWRDRLDWTVDTNGLLCRGETLDWLMAHGFTIQISCDGPREVHDRHRVRSDGRGSWEAVRDLMTEIVRRDPEYFRLHVGLACTLAPPYELDRVAEYFAGLDPGPAYVAVNFMDTEGIEMERVFPALPALADAPRRYRDLHRDWVGQMVGDRRDDVSPLAASLFEDPLTSLLRRLQDRDPGRIPPNGICVPGARKLFVDVEGRLFACEKMGRDYPLGRVEAGIDRGAVDALLAEYREQCRQVCHDCWAARLCPACFAEVRRDGRLSMERRRETCRALRRRLHESLIRLATIRERNPAALRYVEEIVYS